LLLIACDCVSLSAGVRDAALKEKRQRLGKGGELGSDDDEGGAAAADGADGSSDDDEDDTVRCNLHMSHLPVH
jgi:hypothetical protein